LDAGTATHFIKVVLAFNESAVATRKLRPAPHYPLFDPIPALLLRL
jgi:hypothetical protein